MMRAIRADGSVNVVIETPRGASAKFKYDAETGAIMLSRPLPAGVAYPYDWGMIPSTRAADGDPLDVMVLWDGTGFPGLVVPSRLIGVLRVEQTHTASGRRERNDRLFALPSPSPRHDAIRSIFDVAERVRLELEQFFVHAVAFEGKELRLLGFAGREDAEILLRDAVIESR